MFSKTHWIAMVTRIWFLPYTVIIRGSASMMGFS